MLVSWRSGEEVVILSLLLVQLVVILLLVVVLGVLFIFTTATIHQQQGGGRGGRACWVLWGWGWGCTTTTVLLLLVVVAAFPSVIAAFSFRIYYCGKIYVLLVLVRPVVVSPSWLVFPNDDHGLSCVNYALRMYNKLHYWARTFLWHVVGCICECFVQFVFNRNKFSCCKIDFPLHQYQRSPFLQPKKINRIDCVIKLNKKYFALSRFEKLEPNHNWKLSSKFCPEMHR